VRGHKLRPEVIIYTDGACITNPGPGGYGAVLQSGSRTKELSGGYRLTTNNRMELVAAIVALQALKRRCAVTLHSDSEYLVHAMREGRAYKWRKKGWKKGRKWVLNADLWAILLELCEQHEVEFVWVRGHTGIAGNERADRLSMIAAEGTDLRVDEAYEAGETQIKPPSLF
jgi:ribonuclease HI